MTQTTTRDDGLLRALIEELRPYASKPLGSGIVRFSEWFDSSGRTLADAHSKNPPDEKSPVTEATGLSEIADQQQPEAEHG